MAIYTTFFLAEPKALADGFPGWRPPLAKPVRREFRNPFTGEAMVTESREPDWSEPVEVKPGKKLRVIRVKSTYTDYLEDRLPPFVRRCRHWATKGVTEVELTPLLEALGVKGSLEPALYAPPIREAALQQLPAKFASALLA
jgi:hypothetical protein